LQLAERVGRAGAVTGVDISAPMLEVARGRPIPEGSARPVFRQADAQSDDLGGARFDAAFSRFGVMFFANPSAAFGNIAAALRRGGRLALACWAPFADNPWMAAPLMAAAPFLPPEPPADPTAPGPFAFADPDRVRGILADGGFTGVSIDRFESLIGGADLDKAVALALQVGPLGRALRDTPDVADKVVGAVRETLARYVTPDGVRLASAVWIVSARR
jgi:SAM-dependent methyltransferase